MSLLPAIITDNFNTREMATAIWLIGFSLAFAKTVMGGVKDISKVFFSTSILAKVFTLAIIYFCVLIWLLFEINFWQIFMLKESMMWFILTAPVLMYKISQDNHSFKGIMKNGFHIIIILEFIINMRTFPLWTELLLLPFMTFMTLVSVVSDNTELLKDKADARVKVKVFADWVLLLSVIIIMFITFYRILTDFSDIDVIQTIQIFALQPILLIAFMPFLYCLLIHSTYETIMIRIMYYVDDEAKRNFVKWRLLKTFHINVKELKVFAPFAIRELTSYSDRDDIIRVFDEFKKLNDKEKI